MYGSIYSRSKRIDLFPHTSELERMAFSRVKQALKSYRERTGQFAAIMTSIWSNQATLSALCCCPKLRNKSAGIERKNTPRKHIKV